MTVRLVDDENDWSLSLDMDQVFLDALAIQLQANTSNAAAFRIKFEAAVRQLVGREVDSHIKPPTSAQVRYALDIARELGVAIPGEAVRYRGSMANFLTRFAPLFKERRRA